MPPDTFEDNDSPDVAGEFWSGCLENELNIDQAGDDDYYYLDVPVGWEIQTEIRFDPAQGELQLFLDGVEASDVVLENNIKRVSVSGCGSGGRSLVRVTGARSYYDLCMSKNAEPSCDVVNW